MLRTRSIWFTCITLGVLLALFAAGRANAQAYDQARTAPPGPAHTWVSGIRVSSSGADLVAGQFGTIKKTETGGQGDR
jgi:hypothetical protein